MKSRVIRLIKKTGKIIGITVISIFLLLFLLPYILPGTISRKIKTLVNHSIDGEVNFSRARLSFFNHFPALTLSLEDFSLLGAAPFEKDTLLKAEEIAFGIEIPALIRGDINIDKFFITRAKIGVEVNENGDANYNVYKSSESSDTSTGGGGDTTARLRIEKIVIEESDIVYDDKSSGVLIKSKGTNYSGRGDLSKAIFDLSSHLTIDSLDFYYYQQPYVLKKKIDAEMVTQVNTNSLALKFPKNKLLINRLPLVFSGRFDFLSKGYDMDFKVKSDKARLRSLFTVLPPSYNGWLKKTKMKGDVDLKVNLSGRYIAGTDTMPSLDIDVHVRDGNIKYKDAPAPLSNLYLDLNSKLPSFNMDSLILDIDSVYFNVEKDHLSSVLKIKGFDAPYIFTRTSSSIDLEMLDKAIGLEDYDLKGKLDLQLSMNGRYATGQNPDKIRRDIIITSVPSFDLRSSLHNGYLFFTSLPKPIDHFSFDVNAQCPDNDYKHTSVSVENIDIKTLSNYLRGFVRLKNAGDFPVEADLEGNISLSEIRQFYPLDSMSLAGNLALKIKSSGNYLPANNIFPKTEALVRVQDASVKTKYYSSPLEKINIEATVQNKEGTLDDLAIDVKPVSFEFEGNRFVMKADLRNFENISYDISSKGKIDLAKISRVFSVDGWKLKGTIETDLSLKGNQADAAAGRYSRLNNSGTLKVQNISLYSDLYPLPFLINNGVFNFHQDQMQFRNFTGTYGSSTVDVNGNVSNVFNYIAGSGPLKGNLALKSGFISLDELMAYNSDSTSFKPDSVSNSGTGVILIPKDLDLRFTANIDKVSYDSLVVVKAGGEILINNGEIKMNQVGFTLADAETKMDATYKSLSPARAFFTYHIAINDFDVKKMYDGVKLFRELAPAAAKAQGIISLDYELEGKLDDNMYPIMPSLKGKGVLSVKNVKMKGFRFFSAMGRETGKDEIKDPDLSKINFKTSIKNNVVTLEKTKIKVAGFRLRLQGQTSFDGKIKFKCRLGLPPFGIIGIPMNITGTGENPRIKVGKGDELPLEEQQEEMNDTDN